MVAISFSALSGPKGGDKDCWGVHHILNTKVRFCPPSLSKKSRIMCFLCALYACITIRQPLSSQRSISWPVLLCPRRPGRNDLRSRSLLYHPANLGIQEFSCLSRRCPLICLGTRLDGVHLSQNCARRGKGRRALKHRWLRALAVLESREVVCMYSSPKTFSFLVL